MSQFDGFPHGAFLRVAVPPGFFTQLLAQIDDLHELKLTLFCLRTLSQRGSRAVYLRYRHFTGDDDLMRAMGSEAMLQAALLLCCERQTLLCAEVEFDDTREPLYFINTPKGRSAVTQIQRGLWQPHPGEDEIEALPERPNVYTLYEQNIGLLTARIAEELKDAEAEFPALWLEDAIRIAVAQNKRSWRYVRAILTRWKTQGRPDETFARPGLEDGKRYIGGKYADFIES